MTVQSVNVRFITSYSGRGTREFQRDLNTLTGSVQRVSQDAGQSFTRFGRFAQAAGTALMVGLGAALAVGIKASIDFEDAFAGVRKTVDASEATFQNLAAQIRDMALEIPIAATELARIGELGGQLGVPVEALDEFIEVIAKLGVTTNLETDEAATALARFANVMGSTDEDFDNIASSLVDLGNNFATSEKEILGFATRLSGIGATIGLTEGDVLGLATAFTALGEPAERGATAVQRAFTSMFQAVNQGNEDLQIFAEVAGVTAEEFAKIFNEDAAQAFILFSEGLGRIVEQGGDVTTILQDLGLGSQRTLAAMLKAAQGADEIARAVGMGNQAFEESIALNEEAEKRFGTTVSQLGILKNQFFDLGIELGDKANPAFRSFLGFLGGFFDVLRDNVPVLQVFGLLIAGLATSRGALRISQFLHELFIGFRNTGVVMGEVVQVGSRAKIMFARLGHGLGAFSGVLSGAALVLGLVATAFAVNRQHANAYRDAISNLADEVERFNDGAAHQQDVVKALGEVLAQKTGIFDFTADLEGAAPLLHELGISVSEFTRLATTDMEAFDERMREILRGQFGLDEAQIDELFANEFRLPEVSGDVTGQGRQIAQFGEDRQDLLQFLTLLRETQAATASLRREEEIRERERQLASRAGATMPGTPGAIGMGGPDPSFQAGLDGMRDLVSGFIGTQEEYDQALLDMVESTTEFGDDWIGAWDEIIDTVNDSIFDWSTALSGFETTTKARLGEMQESLRNWITEQSNITGALQAIVKEFGAEAGQFFLTELSPEEQGRFGAAWAQGNVNSMLDTMQQILDARQGLMGESIARLLAIAPATAEGIMSSWETFLNNELIPQLIEDGFIEGTKEFDTAIAQAFTDLMLQIGEQRPELSGALRDVMTGAAQDVIANINDIPIGAMSKVVIDEVASIMRSEATTAEKISMFQAIGFSYAEAVALAFYDLPFMLGETLIDPASSLRSQRFREFFMTAGEQWARWARDGFGILPAELGRIATSAGIEVTNRIGQVFRAESPSKVFRYFGEMAALGFEQGLGPAMNFHPSQPILTVNVPAQQANGPSITINNPRVDDSDILSNVKRASSLIGLTRAAEVTPGFN